MAQLLSLKICNKYSTKRFGGHRWCFDFNTPQKPDEGGLHFSSLPPVTQTPATLEQDAASAAALVRAEALYPQVQKHRKNLADMAAMRASLGPPPKPQKSAEEAKKEASDKLKTDESGVHMPKRTPDAMSGERLREAYRECKTDEEKTAFMLDQLAKGNVPESSRNFQTVTIERGGRKLEIMYAPTGFRLGPDSDPMEFPINGPKAQAIADATGTMIPTKWMVDQIYDQQDKNTPFVPFIPQVFSHADSLKMGTPEYIEKHNKLYKDWAKDHNIDINKPMYGYYKHVIQPEPGVTGSGRLEIYGGFYEEGGRVQGLSAGFHEDSHDDYSQSVQLTAQIGKLDGKPVHLKDVFSDPELAKVFGFTVIPKNNGYIYSHEIGGKVAYVQKVAGGKVEVTASRPQEAITPYLNGRVTPPALNHAPPKPEEVASNREPIERPMVVTSSRPPSPNAASTPPQISSGRKTPVSPSIRAPLQQASAFIPSPVQQERVAPSQAPTPVHGLERKSVSEQPQIKGSSLLVGDSITEGLAGSVSNPNLNVDGKINTIAKSGRFTSEALEALSDDDGVTLKREVLEMIRRDNVKNMVLLIGTNDVGGAKSAQDIFNTIEKIWKLGKDAGLNVYACTIPPFKGYAPYESNFQRINEKRNDLNKLIMGSSTPTQVIKLHELMADPVDKDKMAEKYEREGSPDHLHPSKMALASLYAGEIAQDQGSRGAGEGVRPKPAGVQQPVSAQVAEVPLAPKSSTSLKPLEAGETLIKEFNYGLDGERPPQREARLIRTANGQEVVEFELGRVVIQEGDIQTIDQVRSAYKTAEEFEGRGHLAFLLLHLNLKANRPINSVMTYSFNGINGLARFEIHTDKVRPKPHPGIGMWTK